MTSLSEDYRCDEYKTDKMLNATELGIEEEQIINPQSREGRYNSLEEHKPSLLLPF